MDGETTLHISLHGTLAFETSEGLAIEINDRKARALLAILASSPGKKKSREWLKLRLWSRSPNEQASGSLRQTVFNIRKKFREYGDFIEADRHSIWLENCDIFEPAENSQEFFEDAPNIGSLFDDWLLTKRNGDKNSAFVRKISGHPNKLKSNSIPAISIGYEPSLHSDPRTVIISERVCDHFCQMFKLSQYHKILDTRGSNQFIEGESRSMPELRADCHLEIKVTVLDADLELCLMIKSLLDGEIFWISSHTLYQNKTSDNLKKQLLFVVANSIPLIDRQLKNIQLLNNSECGNSLYSSVNKIFKFSKDSLIDSCSSLQMLCEVEKSATTLSWMAFAAMLKSGEKLIDDTESLLEAENYLANALEIDPQNAIALAIAGHFQAFVVRDFAYANELLNESVKIAPALAFAWDAKAMHAIYTGDISTGLSYSNHSLALSRNCPNRFYFEASAVVSYTLSGRHEEAIKLGDRILAKRDGFLPVLRHIFSSCSELGLDHRSHTHIKKIQSIDPEFNLESIADPNYPLPSELSRSLIEKAIQRNSFQEL